MTQLNQILTDVFAVNGGGLADDTPFQEIASWDSMTHMILITRVESEFDFQMSGDEIASLATIGDLRQIVAKAGA